MTTARLGHPNLGFGVGLRSVHFNYLLDCYPLADGRADQDAFVRQERVWFEAWADKGFFSAVEVPGAEPAGK